MAGYIPSEKKKLFYKIKQRKISDLHERASYYNKQLKLNATHLKQLKKLNTKFWKTEKLIYQACLEIDKQIQQNKHSKTGVDDYEIGIEILFYSKAIHERYPDEELDYIYHPPYCLSYRKLDRYKPDVNERQTNWMGFAKDYGDSEEFNPLKVKNATRTFYELYRNSVLSIADILLIDMIWWDISVRYQYQDKIILKRHSLS